MRGYLMPVEPSPDERGGQLEPWEALAVGAVGNVIEFWGFKRNQGRVWAVLYLRDCPLAASEIQEELGLSKGAVSIITRELEQWGVIHRVRGPDESAWSFVAEKNLMAMVTRVFAAREVNLVARVRADLVEAERLAQRDKRVGPADLERLRRMRLLADLADRSLTVFLKTAHLDASGLMKVLRASARRGKPGG